MNAETYQNVKRAFHAADANQDGFLSLEELTRVMVTLGMETAAVHRLLEEMDKNEDAKVDMLEFLDWVFSAAGEAVGASAKLGIQIGVDKLKSQVRADGSYEKSGGPNQSKTGLEAKANEARATLERERASADAKLSEAMPAMQAAAEAINCLDKNSIAELKCFGRPPPECLDVCAAVAYLLKNVKKKQDWKGSQKMMSSPNRFIDEIKCFNGNDIPVDTLQKVEALTALPFFNYDTMKGKSLACANLANWVLNVVTYHKIYIQVAPMMERLEFLKAECAAAEAELSE